MMPENSVYGPWPTSGEIDLMEARGNNVEYDMGGRDVMLSSIHWGKLILLNLIESYSIDIDQDHRQGPICFGGQPVGEHSNEPTIRKTSTNLDSNGRKITCSLTSITS